MSTEAQRREKRTVRKTVNLEQSVWQAIAEMAANEGRSASTAIQRILKKDPSVQIFIRAVGGREGRN